MSYCLYEFIATLFLLEMGAGISLLYLLPAMWRAGRSPTRLKLMALAVLTYPVLVLVITNSIGWALEWPALGDGRHILGVFVSSIVFTIALREISGAPALLFAGCAATATAMIPFPVVEYMSTELISARVDLGFMLGFVFWNVVLGVWVTIWSMDDRNKWVRSATEFCRCGYDLTGLPGPCCPECGAALRQADAPQD